MVESKISDRIEFLAKTFDVFDSTELKTKIKELEAEGYSCSTYRDADKILAVVSDKVKGNDRSLRKISVSLDVFTDAIGADPTPNKSCVQWMLNVFTRLLRNGKSEDINTAIRFVVEDLPQANNYITVFEANKRKNKFKELCKSSYVLLNVKDPTDINQYKSLSQLFDAIDPFIEKNPSELENILERYVNIGQAEIPVKDRKFTLYIPKSTNASVVFEKFANWCTARPNNGMFTSYTNKLRPDGTNSSLYIIINNKFFTNESNELYQIHFESNQIKDRHNSQNVSIFEDVISQSEGLSNYFHKELLTMAKQCKTGLDNNQYLEFLIKFGFCESLFEFIDENAPTIRFMTREIPRMPDLSKFKNLDQLIITSAKMVELHPSIGKLKNLEMMSLTDNKIKSLPKEIGSLKNLMFLSIAGNPICEIPEEIKYLDKSNGGSLFRLAVNEDDIGEDNYQKLKRLLPTTLI